MKSLRLTGVIKALESGKPRSLHSPPRSQRADHHGGEVSDGVVSK